MAIEAIPPAPPVPGGGLLGSIRRRPGTTVVAGLVAISALFYLLPGIDVAVSGYFYDRDGAGFAQAQDPILELVRDGAYYATIAVVVAGLVGLFAPLALNRPRVGLWPRQAAYVLSVYILGPGLIVNGFMKEYFGRARPRDLAEFGGSAPFSPVWVVSDGCSGNCSFASGEASAAAALLCLIPMLPKTDRLAGGLAITAVALIISFNRIVVGAHFLSDVAVAWAVVLLVIVAMRWLFLGERGRAVDAAIYREAGRQAAFRGWIMERLGLRTPVATPSTEIELRETDSAGRTVRPRTRFKRLSVVIPAKNEAENLAILVREIGEALGKRAHEIIVVDDGSTDDTAGTLVRLRAEGAKVRHLRHDRSAGQSRAIRTGVFAASGDLVVTIDGDGQNDPAFIPRLVETLEAAGANVGLVAGQRVGRQDTRMKRFASRFANGIRTAILKDRTRDTGCGLKAMPTELFRKLPYFDGWHRYFPALVLREGYEIAHVDVRDRERRFGTSNYGVIDRGLRGILDLYGVWWLLRRARKIPEVTEIIPEEEA